MSQSVRRGAVAALLLILALAMSGCSQPSSGGAAPAPASGAFPLTITDDAGRSVTFDAAPERLISLSASNTEFVYAVGLQDKLVGVDDFSNYPPEAQSIEKVGGFSQPNLEKIVSLSPDLILASDLHVAIGLPEFEKRGLKVVVIQPETLDQVPAKLELLGKVGGAPDTAQQVAADYRARVEGVTAKVKDATSRPRVFFELDPELYTAGPGSFMHDMIVKAGGENIAADATTAWPQLSAEAVVLRNPQIIILSDHMVDAGGVTAEAVQARPGWDAIEAVKDGRIVPVPDRDVISRPGPRAVEGLEFLAKTIHPDLFK